jgi:predicted phage-related endonuclease
MAWVYILRQGKEDKFKIGRTTRLAESRLEGLQTGNPDLTIFHLIETEHETTVENYIHRRLATKKIINGSSSTEFFAVSVAELQRIISEADVYIREYLPTIEQAKDFGAEEPDGSTKKPSNAAVDTHHELLKIEEEMARLEAQREYFVAKIKISMGNASELSGIATWKNVETNRFNSAVFKIEHPDIYEKYLKTSIGRVFKLKK